LLELDRFEESKRKLAADGHLAKRHFSPFTFHLPELRSGSPFTFHFSLFTFHML